MEKRTDLALEARESFPQDHVEVEGVVLKKDLIKRIKYLPHLLIYKMIKVVRQ